MKGLWMVGLGVALSASLVSATPRTWTSADGRHQTEAELIEFRDGQVHLRRVDGGMVTVPLDWLSPEDREFVRLRGSPPEPIGEEVREWRSVDGRFSQQAEFLGFSPEGHVRLRTPEGRELTIDPARLSVDDQRWLRRQADPDSGTAADASVGEFGLQEVTLETVRLELSLGRSSSRRSAASDYYLQLTTPQRWRWQFTGGADPHGDAFRRLVRAEPRYESPRPLRGVVELGSQQFAFALDATGPRAVAYDTLYFDFSNDGDLTNEQPITTREVQAHEAFSSSRFPGIDLELEFDGTTVDYAFLLTTVCQMAGEDPHATMLLHSAVVREAHIAEGRRRTHLVLLDQNSNGRFDDKVQVNVSGSRITTVPGDLLLVNPNPRNMQLGEAAMGLDRHFVANTVFIGTNYYRMEVDPGGRNLTLSPTQLALGAVTHASPSFRTLLVSDDFGPILIGGSRGEQIPLPEGTWQIANYTLDAPSSGTGRTTLSASFREPATVTVESRQTVPLPFGGPYRPVVTANRSGPGRVYLSLTIVGNGGERCTSLLVNGRRPPAPRFVVQDDAGRPVHQGTFEYG